MTGLAITVLLILAAAAVVLAAIHRPRQETTMPDLTVPENEPGFRCQRCGQSLLHSQVQAGGPPRGFWVTFEDGRLGFDCPAGPGGHLPAIAEDTTATTRRFELFRHEDVSGVSGTGVVAEGVAFSDGTVVIHWVAGEHRSTVVWPDIAGVEAIHGHGGATQIRWIDE